MSLQFGAFSNVELRRGISRVPTRASSWDESKEPGELSTEHLEPAKVQTESELLLGTDHEVTIRVGQESLKLRNTDGKLQMRAQGVWISVGDLVSKWLDPERS